MTEPEDTPTHWIRDLVTGAAIVLAVVQTVRMSGSAAEVARLHEQLSALAAVHVQSKSAVPLLQVVSLQREGSDVVVRVTPLRVATVDIAFVDQAGVAVAGCSHTHVPLAPVARCSASAGPLSVSFYEN